MPATRSLLSAAVALLSSVVITQDAHAQGFISPSFGYNFSGDAGCRTATDCRDKNWNPGISFGALGGIVGVEGEFTYESEFFGEREDQSTSVMTLMGNFMLAPKISIVQPYALAGIGVIRTSTDDRIGGSSETENVFAWTVGGGLIVFVHPHVGLKADARYYYSFDAFEFLGIELERDRNKLDFARAAFGVVFKF
jgi:opacity protein-like surface antigen